MQVPTVSNGGMEWCVLLYDPPGGKHSKSGLAAITITTRVEQGKAGGSSHRKRRRMVNQKDESILRKCLVHFLVSSLFRVAGVPTSARRAVGRGNKLTGKAILSPWMVLHHFVHTSPYPNRQGLGPSSTSKSRSHEGAGA